MAKIVSCGVALFRNPNAPEFLLMKHRDRWDLPKGHVDPGETELDCALRELEEETGIARSHVRLDSEFRFVQEYLVKPHTGQEQVPKQLVIFLGWLISPAEIYPTEHIGYQWFPWNPPHKIQEQTIDPLLVCVQKSGMFG